MRVLFCRASVRLSRSNNKTQVTFPEPRVLMSLAVVAAALFVLGVACWLATSGRLRPRDSPPVVREGKPIVGNLLGFALGKRGPLDFIERNYHRYGGARPRE